MRAGLRLVSVSTLQREHGLTGVRPEGAELLVDRVRAAQSRLVHLLDRVGRHSGEPVDEHLVSHVGGEELIIQDELTAVNHTARSESATLARRLEPKRAWLDFTNRKRRGNPETRNGAPTCTRLRLSAYE